MADLAAPVVMPLDHETTNSCLVHLLVLLHFLAKLSQFEVSVLRLALRFDSNLNSDLRLRQTSIAEAVEVQNTDVHFCGVYAPLDHV
jgi:hypothetical protein